jgi:uncharacterized membrane protein
MGWYERAEDQLENELADGEITDKEFNDQMRDLNEEYEQCRNDAAQDAYDNY